MKAWSDLDQEMIIKSFHCFVLSAHHNETRDNEIAWFKPGKALSSGLERLRVAMAKAAKEFVDRFTESDTENNPDLVIDSDWEEDEDVDIE